jgi:hypothetical protein
MFRNWGFLLGEMWGLILLAALLGLFAGWLIWGGRRRTLVEESDLARLKASLDSCLEKNRAKDATIGQLEARLSGIADATGSGHRLVGGVDEGVMPARLGAPRAGKADDLKRIKGIGPELERLCNRLGFWHFDQIAAWTRDEITWVDANLEGFKGRVTRDDWIRQAKILATGGETEFSKRVDKGEVYGDDN